MGEASSGGVVSSLWPAVALLRVRVRARARARVRVRVRVHAPRPTLRRKAKMNNVVGEGLLLFSCQLRPRPYFRRSAQHRTEALGSFRTASTHCRWHTRNNSEHNRSLRPLPPVPLENIEQHQLSNTVSVWTSQ